MIYKILPTLIMRMYYARPQQGEACSIKTSMTILFTATYPESSPVVASYNLKEENNFHNGSRPLALNGLLYRAAQLKDSKGTKKLHTGAYMHQQICVARWSNQKTSYNFKNRRFYACIIKCVLRGGPGGLHCQKRRTLEKVLHATYQWCEREISMTKQGGKPFRIQYLQGKKSH